MVSPHLLKRAGLVLAEALSASAPVATVADTPSAGRDARDETRDRLQAQLKAQEQKLQAMEQRLAAAEPADVDAARVGGTCAPSGRQEGAWECGGGLNCCIQGSMVKMQTDVTKVSDAPMTAPYSSLANVDDDALVFGVPSQVAF